MPTVCAIILDYFGSSKTIACLTSLIDQGLAAVVIVCNSGDRQANIQLQEALAAFSQRELPFKVHQIVNPQNLGYAAGLNNALRWLEEHHPHPYYLLINNDAKATPGMLPELLQFMCAHNRAVVTAPIIDVGHKKLRFFWYHRVSGLIFSHRFVGAFPYLTGCCLLIDRRIIADGLFDEDFFMYGEDVALSWHLRLSGLETACVSRAIVLHKGSGSSRQGEFFYEYNLVRGHILLAKKLAKYHWEIPFLYCVRLVTLSIRAILRAIRYRSFVPVTASLSAFCKNDFFSIWQKDNG